MEISGHPRVFSMLKILNALEAKTGNFFSQTGIFSSRAENVNSRLQRGIFRFILKKFKNFTILCLTLRNQ